MSKAYEVKTKGLFISFEGAEAVGKSTQIKKLRDRLEREGFKVSLTREPGGTELAEKFRQILKHEEMSPLTELFLVEAGRSDHVENVIRPRLARGEIVLCDRYVNSSLVYQGLLGGIELKKISSINNLASGGIQPDLCFWFDLPISLLLRRLKSRSGKRDRFDSRSQSFHRKTLEAYRKLAKAKLRPKMIRLDASQTEEPLHQEIYSIFLSRWRRNRGGK
jgi:dTMP kinase